jgi:hypothetical protein
MGITRIIWLFPFVYLVHDLEEILTVEAFTRQHQDILPVSVSAFQFTVAFSLLWVVATIGCYYEVNNKPFLGLRPMTFFSFLVPGILLANGISHVLQMMYFQSYVPGVITSVLVIFPYSLYTLKRLLAEGIVTKRRFWQFLVLGFVLQGPFAFVALWLSKQFV